VSGAQAIAGEYVKQLGMLQGISREHMGNPPMLLGEFGITYDMNDAESYRTGDYSRQAVALDANYRALDAILINSTQWNYTTDNSHEHGDQWNKEDLSIFCRDDQHDATSIRRERRSRSAGRRCATPRARRRGWRLTFNGVSSCGGERPATAPTATTRRRHHPGTSGR
jgi:hypothetical protein